MRKPPTPEQQDAAAEAPQKPMIPPKITTYPLVMNVSFTLDDDGDGNFTFFTPIEVVNVVVPGKAVKSFAAEMNRVLSGLVVVETPTLVTP